MHQQPLSEEEMQSRLDASRSHCEARLRTVVHRLKTAHQEVADLKEEETHLRNCLKGFDTPRGS